MADRTGDGRGLNRPVLLSNLASGALWHLLTLPVSAWIWPVSGGYVVAASVFFAAVYSRSLTVRQEAAAWLLPWLVAVALCALIGGSLAESPVARWVAGPLVGLVVATPCYAAWQAVALALRQLLAWRSGRALLTGDGGDSA